MIGRKQRGLFFLLPQLCLLFVSISYLFVLVECKPPKSLNRMRSKGTYNAAAFNSPSMVNKGLLLADFGNNNTNEPLRENYEEYKDDIDRLLEEDLSFYDEEADGAIVDLNTEEEEVVAKEETVVKQTKQDNVEQENGGVENEKSEYEEEEEEEDDDEVEDGDDEEEVEEAKQKEEEGAETEEAPSKVLETTTVATATDTAAPPPTTTPSEKAITEEVTVNNGEDAKTKSNEQAPMHSSSSDLFADDDSATTLESIARIYAPPRAQIEQPQTSDTEILEHLLTRGYDHRVRPPGEDGTIHGGPVVVSVNMLLRSISKIDNVNMEYSVQLTFRESWVDKRLSYGVKGDARPDFLILTAGQEIWMPDSFFQNEKQAYKHMIDKPNILIRVHKDGTILYSYYPMDVQQCFIDLASYAYTTKDIEYMWKEEYPVQLKAGLSSSLPSFQLTNTSTTYCTSKTNTGTYSCLRTILQLRRQFSYYLLQLYIPSCMLVIVSWVSFWIDRTAVPARVTLGVTTLLTMTTQSSGINAKLPPVAYIKAIDVWIGACMTFIFCALLEFACVTYIANKQDANKRLRLEKEKTEVPFLQNSQNDVWIPREVAEQEREVMSVRLNRRQNNGFWKWIKAKTEWNDKSKRADLISRVMFPVLFLTFNISYWTHYGQYGVVMNT